ncbi:extensin-like [Phoenix dactylifera]|uniref:Extensin-like n=1 Tax=Phoenix dactylifera TaxID=42345 RepID=A0A8B9AD95_PHODC|nr:extensin-like [Phoenix dactylifera]
MGHLKNPAHNPRYPPPPQPPPPPQVLRSPPPLQPPLPPHRALQVVVGHLKNPGPDPRSLPPPPSPPPRTLQLVLDHLKKPSPQPPISAATTAAAAASPGAPGLQPPRNPIPQTPTAFSDPVTLLIKDWADCRALFSPGGAKIVAIISKNFSQRDLPLLEDLMKEELARPPELQGFVVANPEIIPELRTKRARPLAMLREDPKGLHRPPHQPSPQPRISVVPAAAATPDTPILQPHPDLMPLSPPTPSDPPPTASDPPPTPPHPPPFLIKDHVYFRALTSAGSARIVAVISPQFPLDQLPVLEATIATESNKPQESQSFVVRNPEILSELRKRRELLLTTAWELDSKITECNKLVCQMNEIKGNIQSVDGLSLAGIDRQIEIVAGFIGSLRRARLDLQRKHRI